MKSRPILTSLTAVITFTFAISESSAVAPDHGETMTKAVCMACHGDAQAGQPRQAPPMAMVKRRYQEMPKEDMVKAIVNWVKKPDAKHSRMPGAVRNFKLMPALPLPDADLTAIAEYIVKTEFKMPKGCGPGAGQGRGHGHGKGQGMGRGQGQGRGQGIGRGQGMGRGQGRAAGGGQPGCDPENCDPENCDPGQCGPDQGKKK